MKLVNLDLKNGVTVDIESAAAALGRLGGRKKSKAKAAAARRNGKKGGRPKGKKAKRD